MAALAPLRALCLDYRRAPKLEGGCEYHSEVPTLPRSACAALCAATALHTLELRVTWSDEAAALCRALPALQHLR